MLPFVVSNIFALPSVFLYRLNVKSKAYSVGIFPYLFQGGLIIIKFLARYGVAVQNKVVVQMSFVKMCGNYYLAIITKSLSCKSLCNSVSLFGSDIFVWVKGLDIMNSFNAAFAVYRRRGVIFFARKIFIYHFHIIICVFSICHTVQGGSINHIFRLFRI